jgi:capsid protein
MALEGFKARIAMLLDEMSARPEDAHEVQERIREQLAEMRGLGLPLPADLVALERSLEAELERDSHPRPRGRTDPPRDG